MKYKSFFLFIIIIISICSCRKVVEIEIPETEPMLVVNSFFCPDSLFKVQVSSSSNTFDTGNFYIDEAIVQIFQQNTLLETLQNTGNGFYKSSFKPVALNNYQIKVNYPNYEQVTSESYIPQKINITEKTNKFNIFRDGEGNYYHQLKIKFSDPAQTENYYEIRLFVDSLKYFISIWEERFIYITEYTYNNTDDPILTSEIDFSKYTPQVVYFSDELINGEDKTLILNYKFSSLQPNEPLDTLFNLFIQFNSISKEYYTYIKKCFNYYSTFNMIYIPEYNYNIYSNIENGFGIFAGYNQNIDSLKFR